ncbi:hypothetical protein Btru_041594 [Bulinus truncatus]|nr:hypothetical protein Btru_041594 [Bulinus truncatus]
MPLRLQSQNRNVVYKLTTDIGSKSSTPGLLFVYTDFFLVTTTATMYKSVLTVLCLVAMASANGYVDTVEDTVEDMVADMEVAKVLSVSCLLLVSAVDTEVTAAVESIKRQIQMFH